MKITLPMTLALAAPMAQARYHAGGRLVVAPRHYQYSRGDWFDFMQNLLRNHAQTSSQANPLLGRDLESDWSGPRYTVSHDTQAGLVTLSMEVPGVKAEDLEVTLEGDALLRIKGSRSLVTGNGQVAEFDQSFQLDEDVDPASLKVTLQNGVLQVEAAKKAKKVMHLEIKTTLNEETVAIKQTGDVDEVAESKSNQDEHADG